MSNDSNPWLCSLAQLYLFARHAEDEGHAAQLGADEVIAAIEDGSLLTVVARRVPIDWDFDAVRHAAQDRPVLAALRRVLDDSDPADLPRDGDGLSLLAGLLQACMDRGHWVV
ncbi:hypothetical protein [Cupriavidus sp. AU9028]|uniref:hypothetical protein n=1 Tax=Cupriavidus sp. AU9028 TaxID=2871157 RepID=UPI001C9428C1|nr:hypothetical protein [Cupriavidus sp. AU9028]MBY4898606.1 hypothetical protein [Cupriavidus sp. AU9028]